MYKVRCSSLGNLLAGCGKEKNKLVWNDLKAMSDAHIKLAIEIYNQYTYGFKTENVVTLDMHAGTENESEAVRLYDRVFKTNCYAEYEKTRLENLPFAKEN